eukprot:Skav229247  [mRNA]  locus=scaffold2154:230753:231010:+ [translate_table: standard]
MAGLGATPLQIAAERGHSTLVRYLLDANASTEKQNQRGKTALHMAALSGHLEVVRLLLSEGSDFGSEWIEFRCNAIASLRMCTSS